MSRLFISQQEVDLAVNTLINQIQKSGKQYDYVVGIRNGGTHISPQIAIALGLTHKSVKISYYEEESNWPGVVPTIDDKDFTWQPNGLLVDDLIDQGLTVKAFKSYFGPIDVAVLFWKEDSIKPEYYVYKKPDAWLVFSWEI
jgi:hypoxanthine phosphoribosyltransferase